MFTYNINKKTVETGLHSWLLVSYYSLQKSHAGNPHTPRSEEAEAGLHQEGPQGVALQPPRGGHLCQSLPAGAIVGWLVEF